MTRIWNTKMLTRLLGTALLLLALFVIVPQETKAADTDRYGYQQLDNAVQKKIYIKVADALAQRQDKLDLSGQNCTVNDLKTVVEMVKRDYPEFFYMDRYGYASNQSQIVQNVEFIYALNGKTVKGASAELEAACAALNRKVAEIVKGAKGDSYQKALYLHDYIVDNVIYQSSANDQSAYGALIEGKAVCAGYSRAYQLLLREAGIESFYITGTSHGVSHAWLMVLLNGDCYYTDVTWDDPMLSNGTQILGHYYFGMSYDQISKDHTADVEYKNWLPKKHDHQEMYYFEHDAREGSGVGKFNNNTAPNQLLKYMKKNGNQYFCEFLYEGDGFDTWFNNSLQNIATEVGEISISYVPLGEEYILTVTARASEHELKKIAYKAPTCTDEGNKEHYECVKCGKRFSDATAKTWLNNDSCVILEKIGHSDGNGNNRCDTCDKKLSNSPATTPTVPSTEATTPPTDAPEETVPDNDPTDATDATEATEATEPSAGATEQTQPATEPTQDTTPTEDVIIDTIPATGPVQNETDPTEAPSDDGDNLMSMSWIVGAAGAVAILAVVMVLIRKLRRA